MKRGAISIVVSLLLLAIPLPAHAATSSVEKGLLITPVRQFPKVDAGKSLHSSFTVANLTGSTLTVDFHVENFSVTDYSYDYTFSKSDNDWVRLGKSSTTLEPNKSETIPYDIVVPAGTAPGGRYFTLFASATIASGAIKNTIQAADLVYLTVNGKLSTVSHLQDSSIQRLNFGRSIPFTLKPINTGNVHSFVYVSGQLHGLFVQPPKTSSGHILIPGHVRTLEDSISSPVLPGVYRATYGYKTESDWIVQESSWIIYVPPWSIALVIALALVLPKLMLHYRKRKADKPKS